MKRFSLFLLMACALVAAPGCDSVLDVEPTSEITVGSFWNGPDDAIGALNGMYDRFRGQAAGNLYLWGAARSEELSYGQQASEGRERYFLNTLTPESAGPDWLRLYTIVHDANLLLKYVPGITFSSEAQKSSILAQAHTMRAYAYFVMARTWGGVPIITEPTEGYDPGQVARPRGSVENVFTLVKEDLDAALGLYPANSFAPCRCQWSKPATEALKGDVYLWTGKVLGGGSADFQTALSALQNVQSADVALLPAYDDVFRYTNKGNKEIIMAVHFEDLESGETYNNTMYVRDDQIPAAATPFSKALVGVGGGLNRWAPSEVLRDQFTGDDARRNATFAEIYVSAGADSTFNAAAVRKFRGFVSAGSRRFLDDVILYRYADVLLMIAEAKNALGQDPSAEINQVRGRAYGASFAAHRFTGGSQAANSEAILQERLLELSFEGKRWWDLVRHGKAFEKVPSLQGRQAETHLLYWPISQTTISLNAAIEQNPGY